MYVRTHTHTHTHTPAAHPPSVFPTVGRPEPVHEHARYCLLVTGMVGDDGVARVPSDYRIYPVITLAKELLAQGEDTHAAVTGFMGRMDVVGEYFADVQARLKWIRSAPPPPRARARANAVTVPCQAVCPPARHNLLYGRTQPGVCRSVLHGCSRAVVLVQPGNGRRCSSGPSVQPQTPSNPQLLQPQTCL